MTTYQNLPIQVATCNCGQLSVQLAGSCARVTMCNCFACQRRTGSPFSVQARYLKEQCTFQGTSTTWQRVSDIGNLLTFYFCPKCGATVYYSSKADPDAVAIAVGNLNDPSFQAPSIVVYNARRHPWTGDIPADTPLQFLCRPPLGGPPPASQGIAKAPPQTPSSADQPVLTRCATCNCGKLSALVSDNSTRIWMCHCFACQRRTGTVFSVQALFAKEQVTLRGNSTTWTRISDIGNELTFYFCPECGASVYFIGSQSPNDLALPVGNFNDPSFPAPTAAIYRARRHPWTGDIPEGAELYLWRRARAQYK